MTTRITAIVPKALNVKHVRSAITDELKNVAKEVDADFGKTYKTWRKSPNFQTVISSSGTKAEFRVTTTDEIYGYVDRGTVPHIIRPRRAKALAFNVGGMPKTRTNVIGSSAGSAGSGPVFSKEVHHPGTKARDFEKGIAKIWRAKFGARMRKAIDAAAQKSGHGI